MPVTCLTSGPSELFQLTATQMYKAYCSGYNPNSRHGQIKLLASVATVALPQGQQVSVDSAQLAGEAVGPCLEPLERRSRQCSKWGAVHVQCLVPLCRQAPIFLCMGAWLEYLYEASLHLSFSRAAERQFLGCVVVFPGGPLIFFEANTGQPANETFWPCRLHKSLICTLLRPNYTQILPYIHTGQQSMMSSGLLISLRDRLIGWWLGPLCFLCGDD